MDTSILTRKIGPFPGWAWGGLVAVAAWYFLLRGKPAGTSTNAAAAGSQLQSGYGLGYAQGLQAAGPQTQAQQVAQTPGNLLRLVTQQASPGNWPQGVPVWDSPHTGGNPVAYVPYGSAIPTTGAQVNAGGFTWYPVTGPGGSTGWIASNTVAGFGGASQGIGGAKSIGSRSANLMHHAHPLIGARVPYQFHVRAVGGAPNHAREVHRVALQSGVHPARLMALNPTPTGYIRVA